MYQKFLTGLAACTAISSIFMVCFVCYTHWPRSESSLPAWVQAVGSVLAILVAVVIPMVQAAGQRKTLQHQRLDKLINLSHLGIKFSERLSKALHGLIPYSSTPISPDILAFYVAQFEGLSRTIDPIPSWDADVSIGSKLVHLQLLCHNASALLFSLQSPQISVEPDFSEVAKKWLSNSTKIESDLQSIHNALIGERG